MITSTVSRAVSVCAHLTAVSMCLQVAAGLPKRFVQLLAAAVEGLYFEVPQVARLMALASTTGGDENTVGGLSRTHR